MLMRIPFISDRATEIDMRIAETIYHAAISASTARAASVAPYTKFKGSPASEGRLQFDLWEENQALLEEKFGKRLTVSCTLKWDKLKQQVVRDGLRQSLHVAYMPTVSTSQILGNNESFEPISSNLFTKTTNRGKNTIVNAHLIKHLLELGLWSEQMKNQIINNNGSVMEIDSIPADVREIYKTVWEMPQSELMRRSALRSAYIDQSQSLNIYLSDNSDRVLNAVFDAGHRLGLKTGSYYIRTRAAFSALKNISASNTSIASNAPAEEPTECYIGCESCSG